MRFVPAFRHLRCIVLLGVAVLCAGCAMAHPRTDDPLQKFNRRTYAFNAKLDKAVIRPVAVGYRKITNPTSREMIDNFFSNINLPITIANDVLQARSGDALESTSRFGINTTVGLLGLFDPASQMNLPLDETDFGVTLARWGVPEGPFIEVPFVGPSTPRDIFGLLTDVYLFDPLSYYARNNSLRFHAEYAPDVLYLVTLRANALVAEKFLDSAYDPYIFERDAYRQYRIYKVYHGNPPASVIERFQGINDSGDDIDQLLEQQHAYEKAQDTKSNGKPAATHAKPVAHKKNGR
ncbi:MAG: VacJ family lipoprotein [Rhodanobacteraceae bacterium]